MKPKNPHKPIRVVPQSGNTHPSNHFWFCDDIAQWIRSKKAKENNEEVLTDSVNEAE